jgi:hypothetical protein
VVLFSGFREVAQFAETRGFDDKVEETQDEKQNTIWHFYSPFVAFNNFLIRIPR